MKRKLITALVAVMALSAVPTMAFAGTGRVVTSKPTVVLSASKAAVAQADVKTETKAEKEATLKNIKEKREAEIKKINEKSNLTQEQKNEEIKKVNTFFDNRVKEVETTIDKITDKLSSGLTESEIDDIQSAIGQKGDETTSSTGVYKDIEDIKTKLDEALKEYNDKGKFPEEKTN